MQKNNKIKSTRKLTRKARNRYVVGLRAELVFWSDWFSTEGLKWPEEYESRTNSNIPTYGYLTKIFRPWIELTEATPIKVLDVGSGPISILNNIGRSFPDYEIQLSPIDPCAYHYVKFIETMSPSDEIIRPIGTLGENLSRNFESEFDLVYARNSIDHSHDPYLVIFQIVKALKKGGYAYLEHFENEARFAKYDGTHHWNFTEKKGEFIIWSRTKKINPTKELSKYCKVVVERENTPDRNMIKLHLTKFQATDNLEFSADLDKYSEFLEEIQKIEI